MDGDSAALEELFRSSKPGERHRVLHYLYIPRKRDAEEAAKLLDAAGFGTETRLGADGENGLVLATHRVVPSLQIISEARTRMTGIAGRFSGEYDGWEAEVVP